VGKNAVYSRKKNMAPAVITVCDREVTTVSLLRRAALFLQSASLHFPGLDRIKTLLKTPKVIQRDF
jgi:hypothetical protein